MNLTELNSEFEVLFEDLATAGTKGLDSYERSICFTHVQEQLIRGLIKASVLDPIASLIKFSSEINIQSSVYNTAKDFAKVSNPFYVFSYFIKSSTKGDIGCIDVDDKFITALLAGAYKYPPKNLAYVVMGETKNTVFPPFNYDLTTLVTKYVQYPTPIILEALTGVDTINGLVAATSPILDASFHRDLVDQTVKYAVQVYIGQTEKQIKDDSSGNKQ